MSHLLDQSWELGLGVEGWLEQQEAEERGQERIQAPACWLSSVLIISGVTSSRKSFLLLLSKLS